MLELGSRLGAFLRHKGQAATPHPPPIPDGRTIAIDFLDEEFAAVTSIAEGLGHAVFISYRDATGNVSQRRISIHRLSATKTGERLVNAFCHERGARRSFRLDRIQDLTDLQTGEVFEREAVASQLIHYFASEGSDEDVALYRCRYELQILAFLSLADGHRHPAEQAVMVEYIYDTCLDINPDSERLLERLQGLHPDLDQFYHAVDAFTADASAQDLDRLRRAVRRLIAADGIISPDEHLLVEEIREELGG